MKSPISDKSEPANIEKIIFDVTESDFVENVIEKSNRWDETFGSFSSR